MASKRLLKKQIRFICGDVDGECIMSKYLIPGIDAQKLNEAVEKVAALQEASIDHANVSFDKTPRDFANNGEYRKARGEYFKKAFAALNKGFEKELEVIIKEMNSAMPKKA